MIQTSLLAFLLLLLFNMEPINQTTSSEFIKINTSNVDQINNYGYGRLHSKFNSTLYSYKNDELYNCLKYIITSFDNEIIIQHKEGLIIDPIVIRDHKNVYNLCHRKFDFYHIPENERYIAWSLRANDKYEYKFAHISSVQLYFETINGKFARL